MIRQPRNGRRAVSALRKPAQLRMTSMMDILTVLLLFLLKSFVVDGESMTPPAGVNLPESTAESMPEESFVVAISGDAIFVGDEAIASTADVAATSGLMIESLADRLDEMWSQREAIAKRKGQALEHSPVITIQGDRDVEFKLLQRVMYTVSEVGFEDVSLAVVKKS